MYLSITMCLVHLARGTQQVLGLRCEPLRRSFSDAKLKGRSSTETEKQRVLFKSEDFVSQGLAKAETHKCVETGNIQRRNFSPGPLMC
jgi:hypothetical protein